MAAVEDSEGRFWSCGPHANYSRGREVSEEVWRGVWDWGELPKCLVKFNIGKHVTVELVTTHAYYLRATAKFIIYRFVGRLNSRSDVAIIHVHSAHMYRLRAELLQ